MTSEFAFLQLPREQLAELHRAVLARWMIEDRLRQEQGLEEVQPPALLERLEELLGMDEDQAHQLFHVIEDELWAHSWYHFTDEWAWRRAEQDAVTQLGDKAKYTDDREREALIEQIYEAKFDTYTQEVSMEDDQPRHARVSRTPKRNSRNH